MSTIPAPSAELQTAVSAVIARNPHIPRGHLRFETGAGRVVLKGVVRSYYQKQMAQELVRHVEGVEAIDNQLEVSWS
ncbi:MAG: BON domain-containing protein [Pirellulales bacterium]|nr:BON domain-containing protein [Pirellulales bacterium]